MKQIKTMLAALFILIAVSSCNKETDSILPAATPAAGKLAKIEWVGTNKVHSYAYNSDGRLANFKDKYFDTRYVYAAGSLTVNMFEEGNVPFVDLVNITFANNKITSFGMGMYNNGQPNPDPELNSFEYDANGFQVKKSYGGFFYEYTVINGNTVHMKHTNYVNGRVYNTAIEYYPDKINKLNLNLFENWYFDQYTVDNEMFGTTCKNLPKKVTDDGGVKELSYIMNAGGFPTQINIKSTTVAGVVSTETIKLTYQ